mgnify:CR=1 FL=1
MNPEFIKSSDNIVKTSKKMIPPTNQLKIIVFEGQSTTSTGEVFTSDTLLKEFGQGINEFFSMANFESDDSEQDDDDNCYSNQ